MKKRSSDKQNLARGKKRQERIFLLVMMAIPVLHFLLFFVYINLDTIALSFQSLDRSATSTGEYIWVGFRNYREIFTDFASEYSIFPRALRNSLLLFLLNNLVLLPLGILFSFLLHRRMPLSGAFRVIFYLPSIISVVVLTMLFKFVFDSTNGIMNPLLEAIGLGNIIPEDGWMLSQSTAMWMVLLYCFWAGIGGNIPLLSGAIQRIPPELYEAGQLGGISMMQELRYIILPLIGTTISTLWMFGTTVIFTIFLQPKLLTNGGPDGETYTIALYIVQSIREGNDLTMGATVGILCALIGTPIVVFTKKGLERIFPAYEY